MARKRKGGWYGEPGRHADAARGIKSKGITFQEKELRRKTQEYLTSLTGERPVSRDEPVSETRPVMSDDNMLEVLREAGLGKADIRNVMFAWRQAEYQPKNAREMRAVLKESGIGLSRSRDVMFAWEQGG